MFAPVKLATFDYFHSNILTTEILLYSKFYCNQITWFSYTASKLVDIRSGTTLKIASYSRFAATSILNARALLTHQKLSVIKYSFEFLQPNELSQSVGHNRTTGCQSLFLSANV